MTRREEIEQTWFSKAVQSNHRYDEKTFKEAVEWADKTMIEKACEWLENIDYEMQYLYSEDGYTFFDTDKFIKDFRQAMEE